MGTYNMKEYGPYILRYEYGRYDQDPSSYVKENPFNPGVLNFRLCQYVPDYRMAFADAYYRTCLKPGGALTDEKALARFRSRMAEIDDAIVCEACRWGRCSEKTRETWLANCGECLFFIANRLTYMTQQYRARGWYPSIDPPTVSIADGKATFTAANPVYYTLDGSDPRTNGILAPADGVTLPATGTTIIRACCKSYAGEWSALNEETFVGRDPAVDAAVKANLRVAEVMSSTSDGEGDGSEYVVLVNRSASESLVLGGVRLTCAKLKKGNLDVPSLDITLPADTPALAPGASLRLAKADHWPTGKISNGGVQVMLYNAAGETVQTAYVDASWWDGACDGTGASFVALEFGETVTDETHWRPSTAEGESAGADTSN